ncbi:MAG: GNAT family N-acetyltransferase [Caldilineaceae bacterium]|nr:GNAT family N-acetyltransferase [Caldilineaceae bacterium]
MSQPIFVGQTVQAFTVGVPVAMVVTTFAYGFQRTMDTLHRRGVRAAAATLARRLRARLDRVAPRPVRGERLSLRPVICPLSAQQVAQVFVWSNDAEVLSWSGGAPADISLDEFGAQLEAQRREPQIDQRIFYLELPDGALIGRVGLFAIDWSRREGELGILIGRDHWGKGYGRDAVLLLLRHAFSTLSLQRVYLSTATDNVRAQRAFAACGFQITGPGRRYLPATGTWIEDGVGMEIMRPSDRHEDKE